MFGFFCEQGGITFIFWPGLLADAAGQNLILHYTCLVMDSIRQATSQLLSSIDRSGDRHSVMLANLEHYNAQLQQPLTDSMELMDLSVKHTPAEQRWVNKIRRELSQPYDDHQVVEKIQALEVDLKSLVTVKGGQFPHQLYVVGSANKGRFGGNSDLDMLALGLLSERSASYLAAKPGWKVENVVNSQGEILRQQVSTPAGGHVDFVLKPEFEQLSNWYGKHFVVNLEQVKSGQGSGLQTVIEESFREKGYQVDKRDDALSLSGPGPEQVILERAISYPFNTPEVDGHKVITVVGRTPGWKEQLGDWLTGR